MNSKQRTKLLEEALGLHKSFHHDEAEKIYSLVRRECPRDFDVWFLSGAMAFQRGGHLTEAVDLLTRAKKLNPDSVECRMFLGMALADLKNYSEAEPHLLRAVKKITHQPELWENLAQCQKALGQLKNATLSCEKFVKLQPGNAFAHECLGEIVAIADGFAVAETHFRKATELDGNLAIAWNNLGLSLLEKPCHIAEGIDCLDKALQLDPFLISASTARALGLQRLYKPQEALELYNSILWMEPQNARVLSSRNMLLNYLPQQDRQAVLEAHKEFGSLFANDDPPVLFNPPEPDKKLRVAFISPDLRHHSVAFFLIPLLQHLETSRMQVILYHCHHIEDETSLSLQKLSSKWTNLHAMDDDAAAQHILKDAPDIIIDLAGHSSMNRLPLLARRLAPIQMAYLGYPNTTGLPAITHRLVDGITDPLNEADAFATEKLVRFSKCQWVYASLANSPSPAVPDFGAPITFGSFNNFFKVTDEMLGLWSKLLAELPNSRLIIKSPYLEDPDVQDSVLERITAAGIAQDRVEIIGLMASPMEHLATYNRVDVALDTFPYNGTTTTCEALWMGVPVVTLVGDRHASRVGLSLLTAIGHPEWATPNHETYIEQAVSLAKNFALRQGLRSSLRNEFSESLLCDYKKQSDRFEAALRVAWKEWCDSRTPC